MLCSVICSVTLDNWKCQQLDLILQNKSIETSVTSSAGFSLSVLVVVGRLSCRHRLQRVLVIVSLRLCVRVPNKRGVLRAHVWVCPCRFTWIAISALCSQIPCSFGHSLPLARTSSLARTCPLTHGQALFAVCLCAVQMCRKVFRPLGVGQNQDPVLADSGTRAQDSGVGPPWRGSCSRLLVCVTHAYQLHPAGTSVWQQLSAFMAFK